MTVKTALLTAVALLAARAALAAARFCAGWLRRELWMRRSVPRAPHAPALLGALHDLRRPDYHRAVQGWGRQLNATMFGYRFLWNHTLVVADPALTAELLAPAAWSQQGLDKPTQTLYRRLNIIFSEGGRHGSLFTLPTNAHHRAVRRAEAPAFSSENLRKGFPAVVDIAGQLAAALVAAGPNAPVELDAALKRESLDVIGRVGFGADFGATRSLQESGGFCGIFDNMILAIEEAMKRTINPLRESLGFCWPEVRRGEAHCAAFRGFVAEHVRRMRAAGPPPADDVSVAGHLLRATDPETGQPLSDECLTAEFAILLIAGVDTTSHTLAFMLYLVSLHPEVERKLLQELAERELLATLESPEPRPVALKDLTSLPYLSCAIKEAMRLIPVAGSGTFRVNLERDVKLGHLTIPAGVFLWANFLNAFTHPLVWEDPDSFRPERWLDADAEYLQPTSGIGNVPLTPAAKPGAAANCGPGAAHSETAPASPAGGGDAGSERVRRFYPFSQGQRGCIGRSLAIMNYTTVAATLLGRFTFRLADEMGGPEGVRAAEYGNLLIQTKGGLRMHCVRRAALAA